MAKAIQIKSEEAFARSYADRLILEKLTEVKAAVKLSELADKLQEQGLGLAAIRSLLASNPEKFSYTERRWVPTARLDGIGRPLNESIRILVDRFGGPMHVSTLAQELVMLRSETEEEVLSDLRRSVESDPMLLMTNDEHVVVSNWVFVATDETVERALGLNQVSDEDFEAAKAKLGKINWRTESAIEEALVLAAPISLKAMSAFAWSVLSPQESDAILIFDWRKFAAKALSVPGYVFAPDGVMHPEADTKKWISAAIKLAERIAPTVEIEDAAPIDVKDEDVKRMVSRIQGSEASVTALKFLEEFYEITPSVKTFPDDLTNIMTALKDSDKVWWVGGDRFRQPSSAPDFIESVPELFQFAETEFRDDEGELIDVELTEEGLSSTLRKLLSHPLATDVLDEDILPAPKTMPEQLRLVLKPIHRELGTFPLCQIPTGWLDADPKIQELILVDPDGRELQVWANMEARLLFNLIDWWFEQPVESGAVFSLTKTPKPNVFEFAWLDQTDPVVFISSQRMEELREIQARVDGLSTLDVLKEVMAHWPKGADFLTILWEVNVVRRASRRLVASLLSSYHCFYQRSGSPVWHYDAKKVDQGFDKTKRKFVKK